MASFKVRRYALDGVDDSLQRLLSISRIAIVERLAEVSQWLRGIAGVKTRRVDLVLVPGTPTQTFRIDELSLRLDQRIIDLRQPRPIGIPDRLLPALLNPFRLFREIINGRRLPTSHPTSPRDYEYAPAGIASVK